jgi:hypothetical protein
MSSPLSALRSFLSSQPHETKRTDAADEGAKVATVTPASIKRVTEKDQPNQNCNPCNPCNQPESEDHEHRRDETRTETLAILAEWRAAIVHVKPDQPEIEKLKTTSLRFLDSPDAVTAVNNGWDAVSLFGMHESDAPKERIDCWGLVLFLAWGVHRCTVETVDQKVCALRTRSGAVQTLRRARANFDQAIPWWQHPGIMNAIERNSDE